MRIKLPTNGNGNIYIDDNSEEGKKIKEGYSFRIKSSEEMREEEKQARAEEVRQGKKIKRKEVVIGKKGKTDIKDKNKKVKNRYQALKTLGTVESFNQLKEFVEEVIEMLPQVPNEE